MPRVEVPAGIYEVTESLNLSAAYAAGTITDFRRVERMPAFILEGAGLATVRSGRTGKTPVIDMVGAGYCQVRNLTSNGEEDIAICGGSWSSFRGAPVRGEDWPTKDSPAHRYTVFLTETIEGVPQGKQRFGGALQLARLQSHPVPGGLDRRGGHRGSRGGARASPPRTCGADPLSRTPAEGSLVEGGGKPREPHRLAPSMKRPVKWPGGR